MRPVLVIALTLALILSGLGLSVVAIQLASVDIGIAPLDSPAFSCNQLTRKTKWAANDWATAILALVRDANTGDQVVADVTVPSGKVYRWTYAMESSYRAVCPYLFVPILGTDAEAWQGAWRASILLNGRKATEVSWEVTPSRPEALAEYQAYLARNPASRTAHYQVGAAAALAGQDALGEAELKEAAKLAPTWPYAPLALGRLYHRQGKKELALEQFRLLKTLLSRGSVQQGFFTEYLQGMIDDHIKQLEP